MRSSTQQALSTTSTFQKTFLRAQERMSNCSSPLFAISLKGLSQFSFQNMQNLRSVVQSGHPRKTQDMWFGLIQVQSLPWINMPVPCYILLGNLNQSNLLYPDRDTQTHHPYCTPVNGCMDRCNKIPKYSEVSRWGPLHITSLTLIFCHVLCR